MERVDILTKHQVLRSKRRTMALQMRSDGQLIVRVPQFVRDHQIERFVQEHLTWIEKARHSALARRARAEEWRSQFPHDDDHYKRQALPLFSERCSFYAAAMGVAYKKIGLSNATRRWGSCSRQGKLRFQWRLVMAPLAVVDYVIVHELAHLKELNHSKRFWTLVKEVIPTYPQAKKWLRDHPL